ncbi:MAG: triple tyrosine motif-containing protein [Paludibacter sp.]|nr:triple tyrosine motif-containing protein [Paludibacter sp.]
MRQYYLILFLALHTIILYANHPLVRNFTRKEYKSGTQNWAITQDQNNFMYFANNNGMLFFNGRTWDCIPIVNGTMVRSVVFDGKNRFYASTFNDFGYYQKGNNGKFDYYTLTKDPHFNSSSVSNELFDIHIGENIVYFQGEKSIYKYDGKKLKRITFEYRIDCSAIVHNIFWVASQQAGLFMLNGSMFVRITGSEQLINKKISAILPYKAKAMLIVTAFDGVYLFDGFSITPFSTGIDNFLKTNQVFCATTNGHKIVYGTVQRGIAIQNLDDQSLMFVNSYSGLQNNTVLSAAFDNQQNLWLGLDKGIDYVQLNTPILNLFGTNNLYGAGYTSYLKSNTLYFGTNQGLYKTAYPLPNSPMPLQLSMIKGMEGQVWCLSEIDNTLFCGDDQGAFIIQPNQISRIAGLTGTWNFHQLRSHPDLILGCSYQGLFILKKSAEEWKFSHFLKGNFKESSPMFEEDSDGSIWFSHWQKGLFRLYLNTAKDSIIKIVLYNEKKGFPSNRNNTVFRIGNDIVFSSEFGFYRYNKQTDKMEPNRQWNQLFGNPPSYMRLHKSKNGDVWCVSGKFIGVARKQKDDSYIMDSLSYRMLQTKILIGFEHFNFIDDNNLILSTEDGFSWVDTRKRPSGKSTFKVILNSVITTNNTSKQERHTLANINTEEDFPHTNNSLRFEFIAPEYRNDGLVQYSYKLENYDNDWSDFNSDNVKEYNHLPRGNYVFKVKAKDMLEANEASLSYPFSILPAWYETNIAFTIYAIIFVLIVIGLGIFINHRSRKGAVEMKKIKEIEIQEQKKKFDEENQAKKREIKELKNQQLQHELRHKSQELASSTMNLIRKNEILLEIIENIEKTSYDIRKNNDSNAILTRLNRMEKNIRQNIQNDNNWKRFEENFDLVYENYLKRLGETYPDLNVTDKKLCAYIKMNLSSKDMAPLLNMSVRSIETNRYRIRKKLELGREVNLADFLQKF